MEEFEHEDYSDQAMEELVVNKWKPQEDWFTQLLDKGKYCHSWVYQLQQKKSEGAEL